LFALAAQDDATIDRWIDISVRSASLGVDELPAIDAAADRAVIDQGVADMIAAQPEPDRAAFRARLVAEAATEPAYCDSFHAAAEGLALLDETQRLQVLRAMAAAGAR
jgi:hypothetical protein